MSIIKMGNNTKVDVFTFENNTKISDSNSDNTMASIGDDSEFKEINVNGNESHTTESYKIKCIELRKKAIAELNSAISSLDNEDSKKALQEMVGEMEKIPQDPKGQWFFNGALEKLRDFALELGAKVVAEIAMKNMGF